MAIDDSVIVVEQAEGAVAGVVTSYREPVRQPVWLLYAVLLLIASSVYLVGVISPPALTDDVDSVQAQIAHNMLKSGDWVTARLDGVAYLEKPPMPYWLMACSFKIFGVHDWAARI